MKMHVQINGEIQEREVECINVQGGRSTPIPVLRENETMHETLSGVIIVAHEPKPADPLMDLIIEYEMLQEELESRSSTGWPIEPEKITRYKYLQGILQNLHK